MSEPSIQLLTSGKVYGGWESMRITRGIEQLAGFFDLTVSDKWAGQPVSRPIARGSSVAIKLNDTTVITGRVTKPASKRDKDNHSISFSGKDRTADLVKCSINTESLALLQVTLPQLAKRLCDPFGIKVILQADAPQQLPSITLPPEQRIFEILSQFANLCGVLLTSDGLGNLLITKPGTVTAPTKIVMGENALSNEGSSDEDECFSSYTVYSSLAQSGQGDSNPGSVFAEGTAKDPLVTRYCPTVIKAEFSMNAAQCLQRANWERSVKEARAQRLTHTVLGWSHKTGLWQPNTLVSVTDPDFGMKDQVRLISQVVYILEGEGMRTSITTVGKQAYDQLAVPADALKLMSLN